MKVVYKNFVVHPDTVNTAHLAGCAAGMQGKFMAFMKVFWEKGFGEYAKTRDPATMASAAIMKMAAEVGIDTAKLQADLTGDQCKGRIAADMAELSNLGVSGTPSFYVNGKFTMFSGVQALKGIIDRELAEVEKSGVPAAEYYQKVVIEKGSKKFVSKVDRGG